MYRMYIVEDDRGISQAISNQAAAWGLQTECTRDFRAVTDEIRVFDPHIILLDIGLPFFDGYYWCSEIRKFSKVPIIFISSALDNMNIIMAVNMGADDYISKPFDMSVLMAKVQAMLRRAYDFEVASKTLEHNGAALDTDEQLLICGGEKISLSKNEYRILLCLMENHGRVVSREKLMQKLWETDSFVDENTLTVNVNRLRRKLDAAGLEGYISTKFGVGYYVE